MSDRAVSETLGFVMVFAVVLASIGLVTATGYAGLREAQTGEQLSGAERALAVLADNVDDVVTGAPARETVVRLGGAGLSAGEPVTVRLHAARADGTGGCVTRTLSTRPLVFDAGTDTQIAYVAGAVVRSDRSGSVLLRRPSMRLSGDAVVIPVVVIETAAADGVGGDANAVVTTRRLNATAPVASTVPHDVTIDVVSPRADAWQRWLGDVDGVSCTRPSAEELSCSLTADRLTVTVVRVDVAIE